MENKAGRYVTLGIFAVYLLVLIKLVLFKGTLFFDVVSGSSGYKEGMRDGDLRGVNLVPFRTIKAFLDPHPSTSPSTRFFNLIGNVLLFVPLGFLLPLVWAKTARFGAVLLAAAATSFAFEVIQLVAGIGLSDVDDIILNTIGGVLGLGLLQLVRIMLSQKEFRQPENVV